MSNPPTATGGFNRPAAAAGDVDGRAGARVTAVNVSAFAAPAPERRGRAARAGGGLQCSRGRHATGLVAVSSTTHGRLQRARGGLPRQQACGNQAARPGPERCRGCSDAALAAQKEGSAQLCLCNALMHSLVSTLHPTPYTLHPVRDNHISSLHPHAQTLNPAP